MVSFYPGRDGGARTPMQWEDRYGGGFTTGIPWLPIGPELDARNVGVQEMIRIRCFRFTRR